MPTRLLAAAILLTASLTASAATPLEHRSASLQCPDRRVVLDADCYKEGSRMLCTRQTLRFIGADGKELGARSFKPEAKQQGDEYPLVEAQIGTLSCVETAAGEKLVLAQTANGGNCAQCEWLDVYAMDGKLLGSTRAGARNTGPAAATVAAIGSKGAGKRIQQADMGAIYRAQTSRSAAVGSYACPVKHLPPQQFDDREIDAVSKSLDAAYAAALGKDANQMHLDAVSKRVSATHIDDARMASLAEVTGCAALYDRHASCATYFDVEHGNPLSVFMDMKKSTPLRRQLDAAIARLPDQQQRQAAQYCIKLVGKP